MSTLKELINATTSIKNDISSCHDLIIKKLTDKGVSVNKTSKLKQLIEQIDDINGSSTNGKRIVYGTSTRNQSSLSGTITGFSYERITLSGLDFVPSRLIVYIEDIGFYSSTNRIQRICIDSSYCYDPYTAFVVTDATLACVGYIAGITSTSFLFYTMCEPGFQMSKTIKWIAFE